MTNCLTRECKPKTKLITYSILSVIWTFVWIIIIYVFWITFKGIMLVPNEDFSNKLVFVSIIAVAMFFLVIVYAIPTILENNIKEIKKAYRKVK